MIFGNKEQILYGNRFNGTKGNGYQPIKKEQTNEDWLRSATFEELAGAIYEWHTKGYTKGRLGLGLNPVTEVEEWLKQPHHSE